jgi:hypothetical protein
MGKPQVSNDPITDGGHEPDAWVDAAVEAVYRFDRLAEAKTLGEQASAYDALANAISNFKTWLPGVDDHGGMPWDRDDDDYYDRRDQEKKAAAAADKAAIRPV